MYAIRLARAYTGKNVMLKAKGGWHGYNTELLWGTSTTGDYNIPDSAGMPPTINHYVKFFDFNDIDGTLRKIRKEPDLAGLIVEPVMGSAGIIPAQKEFLKVLKEEAESRNFVLIFDEIITGFRLGPSGGQGYYGITPHLATMGKVMGGGLSIGAVVGQDEIMRLTDQNRIPNKSQKVAIGGGTFSCNPMSMVAGVATLKVLKQDAGIYERIRNLSAKLRSGIEKAFTEQDIPVQFTGLESLFQVNFLKTKDAFIKSASDSANSDLRSKNLFNLKLLTRGVYTLHAHGAVSSAHSEADISKSIQVTREIAKEMREGRR
jgi:glutamate-1-semialdehyde 2,1-aminomutase